MKDEDLLFCWCMLTTDVEDEKGTILFSMIVDLYMFLLYQILHGAIQASCKKVNTKVKSIKEEPASQPQIASSFYHHALYTFC